MNEQTQPTLEKKNDDEHEAVDEIKNAVDSCFAAVEPEIHDLKPDVAGREDDPNRAIVNDQNSSIPVVGSDEAQDVGNRTENQLDDATVDGEAKADEQKVKRKLMKCQSCEKVLERKMKRCKECWSGCYCSRECREAHSGEHKKLCEYIQELEEIEKNKRVLSVREANQIQRKLQNKLIKLVGERPTINCSLGDEQMVRYCQALWDTGAMVSLVSSAWLEENIPNHELLSVEEYLEGDEMHLCAANNTKVAVEGVVVLNFGIGQAFEVPVPFIVTKDNLENPIIGYNVIKHVVNLDVKGFPELLKNSCPSMNKSKADAVVALIKNDILDECEAKVVGKTVIPAKTRYRIKCRTDFEASQVKQNVLFSPHPVDGDLELSDSVVHVKLGSKSVHVVVANPTNKEIVLEKGTVLGSIECVSAIVPIQPSGEKKGRKQKTWAQSVGKSAKDPTKVKEESGCESSTETSVPPVDLSHLSETQRKMAEQMLFEERHVFCNGKDDHGDAPDLQMELNLTDDIPVVVPHRQIPRPLYEEVKNFINDLIANDWVRESRSPYSSPIVCVRKKDQGLRLCIDYRLLNKKIVPDKMPIPRIQELLDGLDGQEWFTTLDMAKAYHQGYVKEEFRKYTAFSTPWGHYEWIRVPMGISNAPPAFQRFINQVLVGLRDRVCTAYLDDILVYGRTFLEQLVNLRLVLQRLQSKGIKLRADKCRFFQKEVRYLGRLVSKDGHRPDPADTIALERFRIPPKTIGELRTLLGFLGYYRSYIQDFSRKFQPMYQLLKLDDTEKGDGKKKGQKGSTKHIVWLESFQDTVNSTMDYLKSPEFLVFPDFSQPFLLHTDASAQGLGAVLYQKRDGKNRVVSYGSRTLTDAEKNYHLHSGKLEFLALKWAVTDKFSDYLGYSDFTVFTDNNPLTYVMTSAKLNASGLRWVAELSNYKFELRYRPGSKNGDADGLSRWPMDLDDLDQLCTEQMCLEDLTTVMAVNLYSSPATCSERIDVDMLQLEGDVGIEPITKEELKEEQMMDEMIGPVYKGVQEGRKPTKQVWKGLSQKTKLIFNQFKTLKIEEGMLVRITKKRKQLVLPLKYHALVFQELHCKLGHLGSERVEELARQRFYWPYMQSDIEKFVRETCRCVASKKPNIPERAPLIPIKSSAPFEMVCIDFLHLDQCQGGFEYVLLVTDHYTKFSQAYATKDNTSLSAARKLFSDYIPKFGWPGKFHHDKGREFNSSLFEELHRLSGIGVSNTTPYHPMGNGSVERLNRSLINMLKALPEDRKKRWKEHLPHLMFAYNSTIHKSTGYSPFYLVFGRESRLPIDCILPIETNKTTKKTYDRFVRDWKNSMRDAFQAVNQNAEQAGQANKRRYDARGRSVEIVVGDRVLLRNVTERGGTGKLRSWWEHKIYEVVDVQEMVPVYTICPIDGGDEKIVHRNMLMKVNNLPQKLFGQQLDISSESPVLEVLKSPQVKRKKLRRRRKKQQPRRIVDSSEDSDVLVIEDRTTLVSTSSGVATSRDLMTDEKSGEDLHVPAVPVDADPGVTPAELHVPALPADADPGVIPADVPALLADADPGVIPGDVPAVIPADHLHVPALPADADPEGDLHDDEMMQAPEEVLDNDSETDTDSSEKHQEDTDSSEELMEDSGLERYDEAENSTDDDDLEQVEHICQSDADRMEPAKEIGNDGSLEEEMIGSGSSAPEVDIQLPNLTPIEDIVPGCSNRTSRIACECGYDSQNIEDPASCTCSEEIGSEQSYAPDSSPTVNEDRSDADLGDLFNEGNISCVDADDENESEDDDDDESGTQMDVNVENDTSFLGGEGGIPERRESAEEAAGDVTIQEEQSDDDVDEQYDVATPSSGSYGDPEWEPSSVDLDDEEIALDSEYATATEEIETELERPVVQRKSSRINRGTKQFLTYDKKGEPSIKRYSIFKQPSNEKEPRIKRYSLFKVYKR